MVKILVALAAAAVCVAMCYVRASSKNDVEVARAKLAAQIAAQHQQRAKEHSEMLQLLDEAAVQREAMAKQLDYVFSVVKATVEKPDVGKLQEK